MCVSSKSYEKRTKRSKNDYVRGTKMSSFKRILSPAFLIPHSCNFRQSIISWFPPQRLCRLPASGRRYPVSKAVEVFANRAERDFDRVRFGGYARDAAAILAARRHRKDAANLARGSGKLWGNC